MDHKTWLHLSLYGSLRQVFAAISLVLIGPAIHCQLDYASQHKNNTQ